MLREIVVSLLCALAGAPLQATEINVSAASSLTDALKEVGTAYEKESGDRISFNFAASNVLARQIEEGAPVDLFFSADDAQMDRLEKGGQIDSASRRELLSNTLVVVVPLDSAISLKTAADLRQVQRIAVGDPKFVPVGVYTRTYLEKAGLWEELKEKIVPTENVRAGIAVVESGNADAGFVYATDAAVSKKLKVALRIPVEEGPAILYPVALTKHAAQRAAAEKFLAFLSGEEAGKVLVKFGFILKK